MTDYMLVEKSNGTIEFWTNDKDLRLRVSQNIADIADAISFRRQIRRVDGRIQAESQDKSDKEQES